MLIDNKKPAKCANTEQAVFQITQRNFNLFRVEMIRLMSLVSVVWLVRI